METNRIAAVLETPVEEQAGRPAEAFKGINIGADTVTESTAELPENQRDLVRWLYAVARDNKWESREVQERSGVAYNTLYKVWTGRYVNERGEQIGLKQICERIAHFKRLYDERALIHRPDFVETSVSRAMWKVFDETRLMQIISLVYGESQIGKTFAAEEYYRRNNSGRTAYVRMPACAGSQMMVREIAEACHISPKQPYDHLMKRIRRVLDHSKLLIIDEAHLIWETYQRGSAVRCLGALREIHDRTKCGMVLVGTNVLSKEMNEGVHAQTLKQFRRRDVYELQLPDEPPREDLDRIAQAYGLREAKGVAEELLLQLARVDGLGKICKLLAKAKQVASKSQEKFTWEHFIRVHDIIHRMSIKKG